LQLVPPELDDEELLELEELELLLDDEELDELLDEDEELELEDEELDDEELLELELDDELEELLEDEDELDDEPLGIEHSLVPPATRVPAPNVDSWHRKLPLISLNVNTSARP
jgi:hypothetical protein